MLLFTDYFILLRNFLCETFITFTRAFAHFTSEPESEMPEPENKKAVHNFTVHTNTERCHQGRSIMLFDYFKLSIGSYDERLFLTFSVFVSKMKWIKPINQTTFMDILSLTI